MKILLLAPQPYYLDRGTPIDTDILLRALSAAGHEVDAVVYHYGEDRHYPNVRIHRIKQPPMVGKFGPGFSAKKLLCDAYLFAKARKLVKQNAYDLVHAGEETVYMAMYFKRRFGLPYVYDMDSSLAQQLVEQMSFLGPLGRVFAWAEGCAIRGSVAVTPVCPALADWAREHDAPDMEILHDISQLNPQSLKSTGALRRDLNLPDERVLLVYVGNLMVYQGVDLLLEAMAEAVKQAAPVDLVIAGGSDERIAMYKEKAAKLGIGDRAHFIGHWPNNRLGELLAEADILTSPRTKGVNTPMKIFPYLHAGKPLLATALKTHTQTLSQDEAMLCDANPQAFAQGIIKLACDASLRQRLGEAGKAFIEPKHTFVAHQQRVARLYDRVAVTIGLKPARGKARQPVAVG